MKRLILIISVITFAFLAGCSSSGMKVGEKAPFTLLYMADGKDKLLSDYRGKTVALIFWATWCNFSKYAMEDFKKQAEANKDRDDVVFIAVSLDEDRREYDERIQVKKYDHMVHVYSGNGPLDETYLRFGSPPIPAVYTIDHTGMIKHVGRRLDLED